MTYQTQEEDKQILWQSRPWQHKLEHRWNVLCALVCGQVELRSALRAWRSPHQYVVLAMRPRFHGMVIVCPEAALEYASLKAVSAARSACEFVAQKAPDHSVRPGLSPQTVDSSEGNP